MTDHARSYDNLSHGSLAEEAAKFAEAAQHWLGDRSARGPGDLDDVWADATREDDDLPPECRTCPVCRAKRLLAGVNPEVYEHLAAAATSLSAAVRAMTNERPTSTDDRTMHDDDRPARRDPPWTPTTRQPGHDADDRCRHRWHQGRRGRRRRGRHRPSPAPGGHAGP